MMIMTGVFGGMNESQMYAALMHRDPQAEGIFFAGVKTTGIFCRPTCTARKPRRENVEFFPTASDALHAGYRPCRRCRPLDGGHRPPQWVEQIMVAVESQPLRRFTDADLRTMHLSPARARSWFKKHYGMTFHAYCRARSLGEAINEIRRGASVQRVAPRSGYESVNGFRDAVARVFGMPIGRAQSTRCLLADWISTPLGAMLAIADEEGLRLLEFVDRRSIERQILTLRTRLGAAVVPGINTCLRSIRRELAHYFEGRSLTFRTPLAPVGSAFQLAVWRELRRITPGQVRSYAQLSQMAGRPGAHRAIGRANGDNRLAIVIPCHRVVAADGTLCGYGGGVWRKQWLLDHERGKGDVKRH